MSENSTIQEVELIIDGLKGLVPDESIATLESVVRKVTLESHRANIVTTELNELKEALNMWKANAGEASIMFDQHLELCLQQVRMAKKA